MEERKEKTCVIVLSVFIRPYTKNGNAVNFYLAMEVIQYLKKNNLENLSLLIIPCTIAEYIPNFIKSKVALECLDVYRGNISICSEIIAAIEIMQKNGLRDYILVAHRDLISITKKFMVKYGYELIDVVSVNSYGGWSLKWFLFKNVIVEKVKSFMSMLFNKKQNLPNLPI